MERRAFIKALAGGAGAMPLWLALSRARAEGFAALRGDLAGASGAEAYWARVRTEFMLQPGLIHLNCGSLGATPRRIVDAVYAAMCALESDPVHQAWGPLGEQMEAVREKAAEFLGASRDEVALTRNTTEGMNAVASGIRLRAGDEILTTDHEHPGGMVGWEHVARREGVRIRQIKVPAPVSDRGEILQLIEDHISPRTRVCSFSHVETLTGLQMPMADIARLVRPRGILLVCDGAQGPGMVAVDVKALGVDAYASSSHKWMLAPKGSGLLYIRAEVRDRIRPVLLHAGYHAYSASSGTRNVPHILGHGDAMDFHNAMGRDRVAARCRELSASLRRRLEAEDGLRALTPSDPDLCSGMVTFALARGSSAELCRVLRERHSIVVKCVPPTYVVDEQVSAADYNAVRLSTHVFNTESELDRVAEAVGAIRRRRTAS